MAGITIELGEHSAPFRANHIDGSTLLLLSKDDLSALGVASVGHRVRILRAASELKEDSRPGSTTISSPRETARELNFESAAMAVDVGARQRQIHWSSQASKW